MEKVTSLVHALSGGPKDGAEGGPDADSAADDVAERDGEEVLEQEGLRAVGGVKVRCSHRERQALARGSAFHDTSAPERMPSGMRNLVRVCERG